jgi:hypothetical protein
MQRTLLALLGAGIISSAGLARDSKPGSVQGVWQAVQVTMTGPSPGTITIPEPRANVTILTAQHYSRVEVHAEGPRPAPADAATATADELRAAWGPFFGEAGTYEITNGNTITMRPIVAKNPVAMAHGAFTTHTFRLQGDTLWITDQRNQDGPIANPVIAKLVRIE